MAFDNANRPDVRAYIGATGSGKGVSIREHLKAEGDTRLLVWDPLNEYSSFARPVPTLAALALACKAPAFRVSFAPGQNVADYPAKFALFCRIAFAAGNLKMLVEELADVTSPTYAPQEWRRCTTQGRHKGLRIVAGTQRPASVDKNFLGNCTLIRCFTLRWPADRAAMAGAMDVPLSDVSALRTVEAGNVTTINYIEADYRAGTVVPGQIKKRR